MTLNALKHLLHAANSLADDKHFLVLGSASLLFKPRLLANFRTAMGTADF